MADPDIPFRGVGGWVHEMRVNAKGTVGSFGGRKVLYNNIITRKMYTVGGRAPVFQMAAQYTSIMIDE